jgi:hypothetical protein
VWQLRAARQLVLGLLPLLVIGVVMLVVLGVKGSHTGGDLSAATGRTVGMVTRIDPQGDPRWANIDWTDGHGTKHTSRIGFPASSHPVAGARVQLRYVPGNPSRAYSDGDSTFNRANNLVAGVLYVALVLLVVLVLTAVRVWRRLAVARRPGTKVKLSRVRTRFGLIQRSWLVASAGSRERWVPVFWEPQLTGLLADTPCVVHGDLQTGGSVVVDIDGVRLWSSGRMRSDPPRGRQFPNAGTYKRPGRGADVPAKRPRSGTDVPAKRPRSGTDLPAKRPRSGTDVERGESVSLRRQALGDGALVILAPILGVLWAYINGQAAAGFGVATAVLAGVLFWVPSYFGSDPG